MASKSEAQKAIAVLMTVYPRMEDKTPETIRQFVEYASQSLMSYSPAVLAEMVHPRTGVTAKCRHFPSIAEMREFCDERTRKAWENHEREARDIERSLIDGPKEPQQSPEVLAERARVKEGFRKLLTELSATARGVQHV